jgi:hypothetical protein
LPDDWWVEKLQGSERIQIQNDSAQCAGKHLQGICGSNWNNTALSRGAHVQFSTKHGHIVTCDQCMQEKHSLLRAQLLTSAASLLSAGK